ncbi:MAG: phosphopantothenoylcysteine decarboxylase [Phycisphaerales bacterium]|nr:phosphopantothenoylcysteine decarboxylase [Phycisphaerales bacterium]
MAKPNKRRKTGRADSRAIAPLSILVTAGPTREYIDTIRFISNPSSGRMGYAIATAAADRGHDVTLISGPVTLAPPNRVNVVNVETGSEMAAAAKRAFRSADAAVFTAAVCDYRPARRERRKLPKQAGGMSIDLLATEDIAASLGRRKGSRVTLAFALEDHDGRTKAERKRIAKNADAILLNGPANISSERAKFDFLDADGQWHEWPAGTKERVAVKIVKEIECMCASR